MTDPRYTREALNRQAIAAGWKPPMPSSDFATWCFQRLVELDVDRRPLAADGLAGPKTFEMMLATLAQSRFEKKFTPEEWAAFLRGSSEFKFELIECGRCDWYYVRSSFRGSDWTCPECGESEDVENLLEVPGPERSLTIKEADALMGHGNASAAEATLNEHAVDLADKEWAEHLRGELAYVPDVPCLTVFQELAERLGHRVNQQEVDQFSKTWADRIRRLKAQ